MSNLKQRNLAVLAAIVALGVLIFAITIIRISEGAAQKAQQHVEQPSRP